MPLATRRAPRTCQADGVNLDTSQHLQGDGEGGGEGEEKQGGDVESRDGRGRERTVCSGERERKKSGRGVEGGPWRQTVGKARTEGGEGVEYRGEEKEEVE